MFVKTPEKLSKALNFQILNSNLKNYPFTLGPKLFIFNKNCLKLQHPNLNPNLKNLHPPLTKAVLLLNCNKMLHGIVVADGDFMFADTFCSVPLIKRQISERSAKNEACG